MDENKLDKLLEIGYRIPKCCGLCAHSSFPPTGTGFGRCFRHEFEHKKHTENPRHMSTHAAGVCDDFSPNQHTMEKLGGFKAFVG